MTGLSFEQGPIRPPSEAMSMLVRVSRNCPWNRCAFCPVYKGESYSKRSVAEVHADLDAMREVYGDRPLTVFLQDADPMLTRPDDLVAILAGIRERFPRVTRITTYARSKSIARRSLEDLVRLREAGLDRIHVGMESGSDEVLALVRKGVTGAEQIEAGRKAKEAGFSLSFYLMPGLGGRALSEAHADESARVVAAVEPDFVRLRSTVPVPGTELFTMVEDGRLEPLDESETVAEIRRFLAALGTASVRLESDHSMNLLMELRGDLPADREDLLSRCDRFLALSEDDRELFILGRRTGRLLKVEHLDRKKTRQELERIRDEVKAAGFDPAVLSEELRRRLV